MSRFDRREKRHSKTVSKPITFAWVYPMVLTHRCAWKCGYCPYPATAGPTLPSKKQLNEQVAMARRLGLIQVKISSGEGLESDPEITSTFRYYGYSSYVDYLKGMIGEMARNSVVPPLFPELDLGYLSFAQMLQLRSHVFTLRLFLDSMDPRVQRNIAHGQSKTKWPRKRLEAIISAGRAGIPINSGTMIGLGETRESREKALATLAEVQKRYGHIQSVILRPFRPEPRTPMENMAPPSVETLIDTVQMARRILPRSVAVQFPMAELPERVVDFIRAGLDDLGDFELTGDAARDGATLNAYRIVRDRMEAAGLAMADRLSLFPGFSNAKWITDRYQEMLRVKHEAGYDHALPQAIAESA